MVVGMMELHLALYDNDSLKAKRSVVKRVIHRTRNRFNVSAAEVEGQDALDRAIIAVATVGSDVRYIDGLLSRVEQYVEQLALADLLDAPRVIEHY